MHSNELTIAMIIFVLFAELLHTEKEFAQLQWKIFHFWLNIKDHQVINWNVKCKSIDEYIWKGSLTIDNGESVLTCLTCFESLTLQWHDYERMKVPIEMRKYNWISVPPPQHSITLNDEPISLVRNVSSKVIK